MINEFIKKYCNCEIGRIIKVGRCYCLVDQSLLDVKDKIKEDIFSIGVFLGEVKGKVFTPSIELIDILSKHSKEKIVVSSKAEWLFLCGRDVFKDSIISGNMKAGKEYFVQNSKDENLGLGRFDGRIVKNIIDKGMYLRMEK